MSLSDLTDVLLVAQVLEEVRESRQSDVIFTQKYRINVGDDHKPVIAQVRGIQYSQESRESG